MLAATLDPHGRRVRLSEERWRHIKERRRRMARHLADVMTAVRDPTIHRPGRTPGEEWFLLEEAGPARWLHVVVHYEGDEGWIVTAYPRSVLPRR